MKVRDFKDQPTTNFLVIIDQKIGHDKWKFRTSKINQRPIFWSQQSLTNFLVVH